MPRTNPLPSAEREIGLRLREARESAALSRGAFARAVGEEESKYINYEQGRAKLPVRVAWKLCHVFQINQRWLATGEEPRRPAFTLNSLMIPEEFHGLPFSQAYQRFLRAPIENRLAEERQSLGASAGEAGPESTTAAPLWILGGSEMALPYTIDLIRVNAAAMPLHLHGKMNKAVAAALTAMQTEHAKEIELFKAALASGAGMASASLWEIDVRRISPAEKKNLAVVATLQYGPSVPHTLESLLNQIRAEAKQHGNQGEYAESIGVHPSQLSRWLSGDGKPNADATLRLVNRTPPTLSPIQESRDAVRPASRPAPELRKVPKHETKPQNKRRKSKTIRRPKETLK